MKGFAIALAVALALIFGGASHASAQNAEASHDDLAAAQSGDLYGGETAPADGAHDAHHGPAPINWTDFGYASKDVDGGELDSGEQPMAPPLVMALINFGIFFIVLFFHIPLGKAKVGLQLASKLGEMYRQKHVTIKDGLEEGARLRKEAQDKLEEYGQRIKDVDAEVATMLAQIKKDAEEERERILADAKEQAERTKAEAERRIAAEVAQARRILEKEVIMAATAATETILREKTTPADQQKMFDNFLAGLGGGTTPGGSPPAGSATPSSSTTPEATDEGW